MLHKIAVDYRLNNRLIIAYINELGGSFKGIKINNIIIITLLLLSYVQTDATLLANNSQHCWELLRPFAHS